MHLKDLFLPTINNDHTPRLLQKAALLAMCVLVFLSFAVVNLQALLWQSSAWLVGTVLPAVVVDLTNQERDRLSTPQVKRSAVLDEAARLKAEHMAKNQYFSHYSPEGVSPWYWFDQVSYQYAHAGENLAIHFTDSSAVVDAWMQSPLHRDNIVNQHYTEIGVGTAKGFFDGYETVYVVQLFGTPAAPIQPVSVVENLIPPTSVVEENDVPLPEEFIQLESEQPLSDIATETAEVLGDTMIASEVEADPAQQPLQYPLALFMATTSGLLADVADSNAGATQSYASAVGLLSTQPSALLQTMYLTIGSLVAFLLLLSIVMSVRQENSQQVAYGVALLLLMSGLFYLHSILTTQVVIASESESVALSSTLYE